ncbi:hypothetical protein J4450_00155 [Candidatus Micrarchaeota archaeon]|nr:hypothetical protein [Candidatus Micrarchaeota archaeon]
MTLRAPMHRINIPRTHRHSRQVIDETIIAIAAEHATREHLDRLNDISREINAKSTVQRIASTGFKLQRECYHLLHCLIAHYISQFLMERQPELAHKAYLFANLILFSAVDSRRAKILELDYLIGLKGCKLLGRKPDIESTVSELINTPSIFDSYDERFSLEQGTFRRILDIAVELVNQIPDKFYKASVRNNERHYQTMGHRNNFGVKLKLTKDKIFRDIDGERTPLDESTIDHVQSSINYKLDSSDLFSLREAREAFEKILQSLGYNVLTKQEAYELLQTMSLPIKLADLLHPATFSDYAPTQVPEA